MSKVETKAVKTKKKTMVKVVVGVVILLVIAVICSLLIFFFWLDGKIDRVATDRTELSMDADFSGKEYNHIVNIALFGLDDIGEGNSRSDTIIVLNIDKKNKSFKVISLLRDTLVSIPGRGDEKLNHAFAYGGAPLAVKTINENFKLNISDYIVLDFDSMANIINALGGLEIDVKSNEIANLNSNINNYAVRFGLENPPFVTDVGLQKLDGIQACAYSRIRYDGTGDDRGRTERQRNVIELVFDEVKKKSVVAYPKLAAEIAPNVVTTMETKTIAEILLPVLKSDFVKLRFPFDEDIVFASVGGASVIDFNNENTLRKLHDAVFENVLP